MQPAEGVLPARANTRPMTEHEASRTLVKSPPELWAECSEAASLARHLGQFGEIRITRLEPETAVAWEGEEVSGTVRLEPSGWGTRVILTARATGQSAAPTPAPETDEAPIQDPEPATPELEEAAAGESPHVDEPGPTDEAPPPPDPEPEPEPLPPAATTSARPVRRAGLIARLMALFQPPEAAPAAAPVPLVSSSIPPPPPATSTPPPTPRPAAAPRPAADSPESVTPAAQPVVPEEPPEPELGGELDHEAVLTAALDSLGQAHHRPYSRA